MTTRNKSIKNKLPSRSFLTFLFLLLLIPYFQNCSSGKSEGNSGTSAPNNATSSTELTEWYATAGSANDNNNTFAAFQKSAIDSSGNFYLCGATSLALSGNSMTGTMDAFLEKFDSQGNLLWAKQWGVANASTYAQYLAIDTNDNVYVGGSTSGDLAGKVGTTDMVIHKFSSVGVRIWVRQFGVANYSVTPNSIALDSNDDVYVSGINNGNFGGQPHIGIYANGFIAKILPDGTLGATRLFGSPSLRYDNFKIKIDAGDIIYTMANASYKPSISDFVNYQSLIVESYSTSFMQNWSTTLQTANKTIHPTDIALDTFGLPWIVGVTNSDLNGVSNSKQGLTGKSNGFIASFSSMGSPTFTKFLSTTNLPKSINLNAVAIDQTDNSLNLVGATEESLDGGIVSGAGEPFYIHMTSAGVTDKVLQASTEVNCAIHLTDVVLGLNSATFGILHSYGGGCNSFDGQPFNGRFDWFFRIK